MLRSVPEDILAVRDALGALEAILEASGASLAHPDIADEMREVLRLCDLVFSKENPE